MLACTLSQVPSCCGTKVACNFYDGHVGSYHLGPRGGTFEELLDDILKKTLGYSVQFWFAKRNSDKEFEFQGLMDSVKDHPNSRWIGEYTNPVHAHHTTVSGWVIFNQTKGKLNVEERFGSERTV